MKGGTHTSSQREAYFENDWGNYFAVKNTPLTRDSRARLPPWRAPGFAHCAPKRTACQPRLPRGYKGRRQRSPSGPCERAIAEDSLKGPGRAPPYAAKGRGETKENKNAHKDCKTQRINRSKRTNLKSEVVRL